MGELLTDRITPGRVIFRDRVFEPEELQAGIDDLARYLTENIPADRPFIYLISPNHVKFSIGLLAIIKSGHVCVPINPQVGKLEFEEMMADSPPAAIIRVDQDCLSWDYAREIIPQKDAASFSEQLADVCLMAYCDASGGYKKAAMLTSGNLISNAESIISANFLKQGSISLVALPQSHLFALQAGIVSPFLSHTTVCMSDHIAGRAWLKSVAKKIKTNAVTHFHSVPYVYRLLARLPNFQDTMVSVKSAVSGGCKLSFKTLKQLRSLGFPVAEGYGLTEASPACTWHYIDDQVSENSVGKALSCCEISIRDNNFEEVPPGEKGEVCIRGKNIFKGYYNNPSDTADVLSHGWFKTRDLGAMNSEGLVSLHGNFKGMLNVSGKKVYLPHFERLLRKLLPILDIKWECEAIPDYGDLVKSLYLKLDCRDFSESSVKALLRANFPPWYLPSEIHLVQ